MASNRDRTPTTLELEQTPWPVSPLNVFMTSGFHPGVYDLRWDDPSQLALNSRFILFGVNVYRSFDSEYGPYERVTQVPIGSTFWRDRTDTERIVDEDVSKWYVRSSRRRFWDARGTDSRAAFATLHEVLVATCRLLAPFSPFVTDWMHRELTGESVHIAPYVRPDPFAPKPDLDEAMREIRTLATLGRAAREAAGVNVRQPLARMVCVLPVHGPAVDALVQELVPLLAAELNVKSVEFASSADALVSLEAKPNFRALGQRWGKETPRAAAAVAALSTDTLRAFERGDPVIIGVDGTDHQLTADEVTIHRRASGPLAVQEDGARFAALDTTVTPELRAEGIAREMVSRIQRLRKDTGLAVSDRIRLQIAGPDALRAIAEQHRQWIAGEVLAREMIVTDALSADPSAIALELDGMTAHIALTRDS